jgi:hypothetical protein
VCTDALDNYNDKWRAEDAPILSSDEFGKRLRLTHLGFLSRDSVDAFYDDDGMFGGHSLIAQSFDGEEFTDFTMYG